LAFTKKHKTEMIDQYGSWLTRSQAVFLLEYKGMAMKDIDGLRAKVRDAGGEMHVVKNTLFDLALEKSGIDKPKEYTEGSTLVGFAFNDAAALAKLLNDSTAKSEIFKVKGGFLGVQTLTKTDVKALADLPPLPVMRARLLGTLLAPASQLVRTLAEPARSMAAVIQAHVDQQGQPADQAA
jgi:large subunit ribosomal protein L10